MDGRFRYESQNGLGTAAATARGAKRTCGSKAPQLGNSHRAATESGYSDAVTAAGLLYVTPTLGSNGSRTLPRSAYLWFAGISIHHRCLLPLVNNMVELITAAARRGGRPAAYSRSEN